MVLTKIQTTFTKLDIILILGMDLSRSPLPNQDPILAKPTNSFHEKADMSQACFSLSVLSFFPVDTFRSSRAAAVAILPSALLVERFSLDAWWASPIQ
jgi:hypothetical protein